MVPKWKPPRGWLPVLISVAILAACQSYQRAQPVDQMEIVISDRNCAPLAARVKAGSSVTIKIENRSTARQTIQLLGYPLEVAPVSGRTDNVYWQVRVRPGFAVIEELPTPKKPGDYDLVCGNVDAPDRSQGELTVVRP